MNLGNPTPMLGVSDIHKTVAFYRDALGCTVGNTFEPEERVAWACLNTGIGEVMLTQEGPEHINDSGREARREGILYFRSEDVVGLHAAVRERGFGCSELRVSFVGAFRFLRGGRRACTESARADLRSAAKRREFEMEDPDGYQLWFGQGTDEAPTVREEKQ